MILIGMIANNKDVQEIKRIIADNNIKIININEESIKNIKNVKFDEIIVMKNIKLKKEEYKYMNDIIVNTKYMIVNADMEIDFLKELKIQKPIKLITYGFNSKATITISSVNEEKIIVCLQRNLERLDNEIIEAQEKEIKIFQNFNKKIHNRLAVFIIKELHNLK